MANFLVSFEVLKVATPDQMREGKVKPGYKYVGTNTICDIKMDVRFTRKARLVSGRHKTSPSLSITYSSIVTRESVILAFLIYGLNYLDIYS